jgi:hypothetical protein
MGKLMAKKQAETSAVLCMANFIMFCKKFMHFDIAITRHGSNFVM